MEALLPPGPERTQKDAERRRYIKAVLTCLPRATQQQIADRCQRVYRMDPEETSEHLLAMVEAGVVQGVDSLGEQRWELNRNRVEQ
jgi:hypothetical protein